MIIVLSLRELCNYNYCHLDVDRVLADPADAACVQDHRFQKAILFMESDPGQSKVVWHGIMLCGQLWALEGAGA